MVLRVFSILGALILVVCFVRAVQAHQEPAHRQLPNFDRRPDAPSTPPAAAPGKARAREAFLSNRTRRVERGGRILPLRHFYSTGPYLHRPDGMRRGRPAAPGGQAGQVDRPPTATARESVESFLEEQKELLGFGAQALESARLLRDQRSPNNGMRTLVWQQVIQDIDVYEGVVIGHVSDQGDLISLSAQFLSEFEPGPAAPGLDAPRAIELAAQAIEEPDVLLETIHALNQPEPVPSDSRARYAAPPLPDHVWVRLVWLPIGEAQARLCWEVELVRRLGGELYRVLVDADTGEILIRHCRTYYLSEATYRVFTSDSPQPLSPGHPEPSTNQPPRVPRTLVTLDALSTNASPTGWIHDGDNETRGNNVEAHLDRNGDNLPDLPRPTGSPARVFDFPMDLDRSPTTYGDASAVQLFYWANWMHDRLYELGFTEAAGNFQKDNFGRGGVGGDPLIADAQDGSGFNNANYSPRRDGLSPRIQMFLFDGPEPDRDGSLDADIVLHEYTHGLSDRLVGGGIGITALQSLGMGEGWSDFYALALLSEAGDDLDGNYTEGGYATYQFQGLRENYYFGIRRYPYSTDMTKNPLTFKDIDPEQIGPYPGVPRSPIHPFDPNRASFVHRQGEVWCVTLWEARANLILKHGFEEGNRLILQLVTDGMKLSPPNPTFLQARDTILLADRVGYDGANQFELWQAFAKRGMGVGAVAPPVDTTRGVQESYDVPDALTALPAGTQFFSGPIGGPFAPTCRVIDIRNPSGNAISWKATHLFPWLDLFPDQGTIEPGMSMQMLVCLNSNVLSAALGSQGDVVTISNRNTGSVLSRFFQVQVLEPASMPFHEDFESGTLRSFWTTTGSPLSRRRVTSEHGPSEGDFHFAFDGSESGLTVNSEATLMVDLAGYTNVTVQFWARQFNDEPRAPENSDFLDHDAFDGLAISGDGVLWHEVRGLRDLQNFYAPITIDLDQAVAELGLAYHGQFRFRFHHHGDDAIPLDGIAVDDLSINGIAPRRFQVRLPSPARELDGLQVLEGRVLLDAPADEDITIFLAADDDSEVAVPPTTIMTAGTALATFPITILDDDALDGPQEVTIRASAQGYLSDEAIMTVSDDESARLILAVPARVREGQGTLAQAGLILVDQAAESDIPILLDSPDTTELIVPAVVLLPAGETFVSFDIQVVDDGEIDGDQTLIVSVAVENWEGDQDIVTVEDNEHTGLVVSAPALLNEAERSVANAGQISIAGTLPHDLPVAFRSSQPARIAVPEDLVIEAGTTRVNFSLTVFNDEENAGAQSVTLTAMAASFADGSAVVRLLDNEQPPTPFAPQPAHRATNVAPNTSLGWRTGIPELLVNGGFESGSLAGWFTFSSLNGSFVVNDGSIDPVGPDPVTPPYEGRYSALSRQIGPGRQELIQDVLIPLDIPQATLGWVHRVRNHAAAFASNQSYRVEIRNTANQVLGVAFATQPGDPLLRDWEARTFDLTAWRGQRVRLAFVEEDELGFMNVHLDNVRVMLDYQDPTVSEVYFGADPEPGPDQFLGITTNTAWNLPELALERDYYWRIVTRRDALRQSGPVWRFRTRGVGPLDHFTWEPLPSPQQLFEPFAVTVTARDELGYTVSNYHGGVRLNAFRETTPQPVELLTYTEFADTFRQTRRTQGAIASHFKNFVNTYFDRSEPAELQAALIGKDVFLVMEQRTVPAGRMRELGEQWSEVLNAFARAGGVVIVNSYLKDEHELFDAGDLLPITKSTTQKSLILQATNSHALTAGLPPAFEAYNLAVYETPTNGTALLTAGTNEVIAVSRPWGEGLLVLIGTDYATNRTAMDRLLANAVAWPRRDFRQDIPMSPSSSAFFVEGRWTGQVTLQDVGDNIILQAVNPDGVMGSSNPLAVTATNDLTVSISDAPDPLRVGDVLTYAMRVGNSGPAPASNVVLTNRLPSGLALISLSTDRGACAETAGTIRCELGDLEAGEFTNLEFVTRPVAAGDLTNRVGIASDTNDAFAPNNSAQAVTRVLLPSLNTSSISATEDAGGQAVARLNISLQPANALEVRCDVVTEDDSALAGVDYEAIRRTVVFAPGVTNQTVSIPILGDQLNEASELFFINLVNPSNASILRPRVTCIIQDDDPQPSVYFSDAFVTEGDSGMQSNVLLQAALSAPSGRDVDVRFATADGSAQAGLDYVSQSGNLVIPSGATSASMGFTILGDDLAESNETFQIVLTGVTAATLVTNVVSVWILDDDAAQLDHFDWSAIPSPQFLNQSFSVTLTARDSLGQTFTGSLAEVALNGFSAQQQVELSAGDAAWEYPMGASFHDQRLQSIYQAGELGGPSRITGLSLNVLSTPGQRLRDWTVRLKHTQQSEYRSPAWESEGWTTVYRQDQTVLASGWVRFDFAVPFDFNGSDHLLVDFSFNNGVYTTDGFCAAMETDRPRSIHFRTDSGFGVPAQWSGSVSPPPIVTSRVPSVRFQVERAVPISPATAGPFENGIWSGAVTVQDTASGMTLRARDAGGHIGLANEFSVAALDDLGLAISVSPDPVLFDGAVTISLQVTNTGPSSSSRVTVTNFLPGSVDFQSATATQGQCVFANGMVACSLGMLAPSSTAAIQIMGRSKSSGLITNRAVVARSEPEDFLLNNEAQTITRAQPPSLSVDDVTVTETDTGTQEAVFSVRLSNSTELPVTVEYGTSGITATNAHDFLDAAGLLFFEPGATNRQVAVAVSGDLRDEPDETFALNLFNPTNAVLGRTPGIATILDQDPEPELSVADVEGLEGDIGTTTITANVILSQPSGKLVWVDYATRGGTASPDVDFASRSARLIFPPGLTNRLVFNTVIGDEDIEEDESFSIELSGPLSSVITRSNATVTIRNDDGLPGVLDHFVWSLPGSTQVVGQPFFALLEARDYYGDLVPDYNRFVNVTGREGPADVQAGHNDTAWNFPLASGYHDARSQIIYTSSEMGGPSSLHGLALDVVLPPSQLLNRFTIRLKHTPMSQYGFGQWETEGWTTVYQQSTRIDQTGWWTFPFATPFSYNGTSNLLVDLSFNNELYTFDGFVRAGTTNSSRVLYQQFDGNFGDPLLWSGRSPVLPLASSMLPGIRFLTGFDIPVQPRHPLELKDGLWSGQLTVDQTSPAMRLRAEAQSGIGNFSELFSVGMSDDSDGDGLPDSWELLHFGSLNHPDGGSAADPDGDGASNGEEFLAGTDPRDARSVFVLTGITVSGADVLIRFASTMGLHYVVQSTRDLAGSPWEPIGPPVAGSGETMEVIHPGAAMGGARFYRVIVYR